MSRELYLAMEERDAIARFQAEGIGISSLETLPAGGIRLVCMSVSDADRMRTKFKSKLIKGDVVRERFRPRSPIW